MPLEILIAIIILILVALIEVLFFIFNSIKYRKIKNDLIKKEEDARHKIYEIEILNKLSDKIGYSLDIQNVIEVIIDSMPDILNYSSVNYMLLLPEKIIFRGYLMEPISRRFISDIKGEMLDFISGLLKKDLKNIKIEETLWGSMVNNESNEPVGSFFNIPLSVSGKFAALLTIADTKKNFYNKKQIETLQEVSKQASDALTKLQDAIGSENSKLNAMVFSMTDGVVMTDKDYRVLVVNPATRKLLGIENKGDISISDLADKLTGKIDIKDKLDESLMLDKVFLSDEISLSNGYLKIVVSPVKDRWKTLGCVIIFRDITHEKEVQQIKEDFTSMIVHELRSPLDSIKKIIEMMRTSAVKKQQMIDSLQMIYASSSDMLELVNNLLNIAKIEAGKFELIKQPSDIKQIAQSRISFFDIAAKDAKVNLLSQFGKDIPNKVDFDPHTISQVLNNFISNAMKFNKENGSIIIQAILHKSGESLNKEAKDAGISWFIKKDIPDIPDSLFVAVTNTGIGIAQDQIDKLFSKFFQVKSVFAQKGGTGLGLAISKSIVESHDGIVGVDSILGEGATFYFTLPINKPDESAKNINTMNINTIPIKPNN